jgi:mannonate dehydratase
VDTLKITDVRTICADPEDIRLVVVRVETDESGLYGLGCATFTQRPLAVVTAVEQYLKPFLLGKDPDTIEDVYQSAYVSSYWRSGPVLNNALSGVDMALWNIKGKRAGIPLYQLFGGKCREAAALYAHADGRDFREVEENVRRYVEEGYRYVRCRVAIPGYATYGAHTASGGGPQSLGLGGEAFEPTAYCRVVPRLFEHLRNSLGEEVELLENPFAPEDIEYFCILRQQASTPLAMGELFVHQAEYVPLIRDPLIDFIRVHISDIGGLSIARKLAAYGEFFGIRTAWHGPGDVSLVGHAANLHLDLSCHYFGIQEQHVFDERTREVFPGTPEIKNGYVWLNERPGLGVELDEELAAKYPFPEDPLNGGWLPVRRLDGTVVRP